MSGAERLEGRGRRRMLLGIRVGDPGREVAWLATESVRDVYLAGRADDAALLPDEAIAGCGADPLAEVRSLGRTLARWRPEIPNRHRTGASNGPSEALNLLVKKVTRAGHGFRSLADYRRRILLHAGAVRRRASTPPVPCIRTRSPHENRKGQKAADLQGCAIWRTR